MLESCDELYRQLETAWGHYNNICILSPLTFSQHRLSIRIFSQVFNFRRGQADNVIQLLRGPCVIMWQCDSYLEDLCDIVTVTWWTFLYHPLSHCGEALGISLPTQERTGGAGRTLMMILINWVVKSWIKWPSVLGCFTVVWPSLSETIQTQMKHKTLIRVTPGVDFYHPVQPGHTSSLAVMWSTERLGVSHPPHHTRAI